MLDHGQAVKNTQVIVQKQTYDYGRDHKIYKTAQTNENGELNLVFQDANQYLLKIDYQQPFQTNAMYLKRYKYTMSFNVIR